MEISVTQLSPHLSLVDVVFSSSTVWRLVVICVLHLFLVQVLPGLCNCNSTIGLLSPDVRGGKEHAFLIPWKWMRSRVISLAPSYLPRERSLETEELLLEQGWECRHCPFHRQAAALVEEYDVFFLFPDQWTNMCVHVMQNLVTSVKWAHEVECSLFWWLACCPNHKARGQHRSQICHLFLLCKKWETLCQLHFFGRG